MVRVFSILSCSVIERKRPPGLRDVSISNTFRDTFVTMLPDKMSQLPPAETFPNTNIALPVVIYHFTATKLQEIVYLGICEVWVGTSWWQIMNVLIALILGRGHSDFNGNVNKEDPLLQAPILLQSCASVIIRSIKSPFRNMKSVSKICLSVFPIVILNVQSTSVLNRRSNYHQSDLWPCKCRCKLLQI